MDKPTRPTPGSTYQDARGRTLKVEVIEVGDSLGREVRGKINPNDGNGWTDYSTTLQIWADLWRDKAPSQERPT